MQTAVTAYFSSKPLLLFAFALRHTSVHHGTGTLPLWRCDQEIPEILNLVEDGLDLAVLDTYSITAWNPWIEIKGEKWDKRVPANTRDGTNVGLMLGQRQIRWTNIKPTMGQRLVFWGGKYNTCD